MLDSELKAIIEPFVAGGCHDTFNRDQSPVYPYAVFFEASGLPENGISQYLGSTRHRYEIHVVAKSPSQAKGISLKQIKPALEGSATVNATMVFQSREDYSSVDKSFSYLTEYQIWAEE